MFQSRQPCLGHLLQWIAINNIIIQFRLAVGGSRWASGKDLCRHLQRGALLGQSRGNAEEVRFRPAHEELKLHPHECLCQW
jgi:hypothetical protein